MLAKVKETIEKYGLLTPGLKVVVGFSAGIDSVCLLHILHSLTEYHLDLTALYINHSLRPDENRQEVQLLESYGEQLHIKVKQVVIDIPGRLREKPQSLQLLAREERYRIFREVLTELGADKVALAHHRDDQAETILYRFIRGTGLDGLGGIPYERDGIFIRPLLEVSRAEITEYVTTRHLRWIEDSSNHKVIYRRNRLRHQVIPQIENDFNPRFKDAIVRLGHLAQEHHDFMADLVADYRNRFWTTEKGRTGFSLESFLKIHPYLQYYILKEIYSDLNLGRSLMINDIQKLRSKLINENYNFKKVHIYKKVLVYLEDGIVFFQLKNESKPALGEFELDFSVNGPGEVTLEPIHQRLTIAPTKQPMHWNEIPPNQIYLDADRLLLPLKVRFWHPGDAFRPLGMAGKQKLHDFFINQKIPREVRKKVPLLVTADDQIVWVVGHRMNEDFKVRENTKKVWRVTVEPTRGD